MLDDDEVLAALAERNYVIFANPVGRDIHLLAVDLEMSMVHELPGLRTGGGETGAVDDVVEAALENTEQVVAGDALLTGGFLVVAAELAFQDAVHRAQLLLLTQLDQVVALPHPGTSVLTGGIGTLVDRAALRLAQRRTSAPARLVTGTCVLRHISLPCASWDGSRCVEWGSHHGYP